nr:hypothetical protein [Tanacetum cinerariifolium]
MRVLHQLYDSLVQFEPHVQASKVKKAARNHDPLPLISHSKDSSSQSNANPSYSNSPQPYYVAHPLQVVDYEEDYQGELQGDSQEDKLTTIMMLLAREITEKFSTPTYNRLRTSSNIKNQVVIQDGRVDIQTKNVRYGGNSMKDEAESNLKDEENDFMVDNSFGDETLKELTAAVIMMAQIQPADDNAVTEPTYNAKPVSEVNALHKMIPKGVHEHKNHGKRKIVINTSDDDQIDSNIIFDDPYVKNKDGTSEHDSNAHEEYLFHMAQQIIPVAQLIPKFQGIRRCNNYTVLQSISCSPECKIVGQILVDHPLSYALTATTDFLAMYLQQFWKTVSKVPDTEDTIMFKLDSQEITYTVNMFRDALYFLVKTPDNSFIAPANIKIIESFINTVDVEALLIK